MVAVDALYIGAQLHEALLQVTRRHGVHDQDLVVAASHSHCAPMLDASKPSLGVTDAAHLSDVTTRLCGLLDRTLAGPFRPATLRYANCADRFAINRRARRWRIGAHGLQRRIVAAPNPAATEAEASHVVTVQTASGNVAAVLWSAACHPVSWPDRAQISADYPGDVRARLRDTVGDAGLPVVFMQGCSADLRPWTDPLTSPVSIGGWLHGQYFLLFPPREVYQAWLDRLHRTVDQAFHEALTKEPITGAVRSAATTMPLSDFFEGPVASERFGLHAVMLGDRHVLLGGTAEMPVAVRHLIERAFAGLQVIPAGCINDSFGYLPSTGMLAEGGYEVDGWLRTFERSWRSRPHDDPDRRILDALASVRRQLA